jgi:hypothetical protein
MRPTFQGLLFRTFRMLLLLTMIVGFLAALVAGLEGVRNLPPGGGPSSPGGNSSPGPASR